MKKFFSVLTALSLFYATTFGAVPLNRGTTLSIRLSSDISSKKEGQATAIVENDVKSSDGIVLIERGTPVQLQIDRKGAKGAGKPGYVNVRFISTTSVDGQTITLDGSTSDEGDSKKGLALGLGIGLGLTFLPFVGFAFCAIKGEQAKIANNTVIPNVIVSNNYSINK